MMEFNYRDISTDRVPSNLENIYGHLGRAEGCLLYYLASLVPEGGVIVEIGSYLGKSTAYLATGADESVTIYAIDTWDSRTMPIEHCDTLPEFLRNTEEWRNIVPLRWVSWLAGAAWDGPRVDLWFHDGDHSYEGVKRDFQEWVRHLKPHAIVALHDYGNSRNVKRAVDEHVAPVCDALIVRGTTWVGQTL